MQKVNLSLSTKEDLQRTGVPDKAAYEQGIADMRAFNNTPGAKTDERGDD